MKTICNHVLFCIIFFTPILQQSAFSWSFAYLLNKKPRRVYVLCWYTFILQAKKGVKRKADTTTPAPLVANAPMDPTYEPSGSKAGGVGNRRESTRQIKRPKKDLPDDQAQHSTKSKRQPLNEQLKYCHGMIKELFHKKHAVRNLFMSLKGK